MTEKILAALFAFISSLIAFSGYGGIVILMAIESACIPLPSELIMPFAGYLVFQGTMKLLLVATAGAIGCNVGSLIAYEIGCYGGRPLVERYGRWILMGRRELDDRKVSPQIRRRDSGRARGWNCLVCVVALAKPDSHGVICCSETDDANPPDPFVCPASRLAPVSRTKCVSDLPKSQTPEPG